jgi:hypothetical protein
MIFNVCVIFAAWLWLTAKTIDFPISALTGSLTHGSNASQNSLLVSPEKSRFSKSF